LSTWFWMTLYSRKLQFHCHPILYQHWLTRDLTLETFTTNYS
jgi:hypothetical protein